MSRRPIGDTAMSVAERSRRKRAKAKAQAGALGRCEDTSRKTERVPSGLSIHASQPSVTPDLLAGGPEAIAARIFERVPVEMARDIAMALQQRLLQGGCWPSWRLPLV